jgi:ligand-binding SRPBCC domain-containing protein
MTVIVLTTHISAQPETCFDISLDMDEHVASTAHTGEKVVAGVAHGLMKLDDTVTFEARHFGLRMRMTSKITAYERPHRFVDEMQRGPFKSLWHEHLFEAEGDGTRMTDTFKVCAPLGPLGWLAERLFLGAYMRRLLLRRNGHIRRAAEARG